MELDDWPLTGRWFLIFEYILVNGTAERTEKQLNDDVVRDIPATHSNGLLIFLIYCVLPVMVCKRSRPAWQVDLTTIQDAFANSPVIC